MFRLTGVWMTNICLTEILCCPMCRADLELDVYLSDENGVYEGLLTCTACGAQYPIKNALFYLLPDVRTAKRNIWSLSAFDNSYQGVGYYKSSYEWREKKGISRVVTEYDYPKVKGKLLKWLKPKNHDLILDVGTGSGYFIFEMMQKYSDVTAWFVGLDVSMEHLRWLAYRKGEEKKRNIIAVVGNAEQLPFKDNVFSIVTCTEVLEHVYEPEKAVGETSRVLKTGGRALISTPSKIAADFWRKILFLPHFSTKKNSLLPYDSPLHPSQLIHTLESWGLAINRFELNVLLPPQSLFSLKQPFHIPDLLVPTLLNICGQIEKRRGHWLRGLALHMLIEASKT